LRQLVVLHHILHRQIFDSNRLVFTYQSSGQLVKEICSSLLPQAPSLILVAFGYRG
jgi:hypothetical protein